MLRHNRVISLALLLCSAAIHPSFFVHSLRSKFNAHQASSLLARAHHESLNKVHKRNAAMAAETILEVAPVVITGLSTAGVAISGPAVIGGVAIIGGIAIATEVITTGDSETARSIGRGACEVGARVKDFAKEEWHLGESSCNYDKAQAQRDINEKVTSHRMDQIARGETVTPYRELQDLYSEKGKSGDKSKDDKSKDDKGDKDKGKEEAKDDRKVNTPEELAKFKEELKDDYKYDKQSDTYKLKDHHDPILPKTHEVDVDMTHLDVEGYDKRGRHIGSIDPKSGEYYKPAVENRISSSAKKRK